MYGWLLLDLVPSYCSGWLKVYGRRLAEEGATSRARELCDSLLGPPNTRRKQCDSEGAVPSDVVTNDWQPQVRKLSCIVDFLVSHSS